jgi:adenine-specific DNA-methyltransferase
MKTKLIRYIGSKESLMDFLIENFKNYCENIESFADLFSGTNVVSYRMSKMGVKNIRSYDISSYSECLSSFINPKISNEFIKYLKLLDKEELIEGDFFNEFSINGNSKTINKDKFKNQITKSRMFFSEKVGKKIDTIRTKVLNDYKNESLNKEEKNICIALLLRYADINANTTGVYGAYLKNENKEERPFLTTEILNDLNDTSHDGDLLFKFKKSNILDSIQDLDYVDLIYMDPPYTTRKYESNYHILEYISDEKFNISYIKNNTISALPINKLNNPFGSKKSTYEIFEKMISQSINKCKTLIISYSNQGIIKDSDVKFICDKYDLKLQIVKKEYKKYKSHNVIKQGELEEILWIIKK